MKHSICCFTLQKKAVLLLLLLSSFLPSAIAQNTTLSIESQSIDTGFASSSKTAVLIIPFERKMYNSEIDRELATENHLSFNEISTLFRDGLSKALFIAFKENEKSRKVFVLDKSAETIENTAYVYSSIGYHYQEISEPEAEKTALHTAVDKTLNFFESQKEPSPEGTYIENGQVVSNPNMKLKFMNTKVSNAQMIPLLSNQLGIAYFVFINQLDMHYLQEGTSEKTGGAYKKMAQVHYSIINDKSETVDAGLVRALIPEYMKDSEKIAQTIMESLAVQIADFENKNVNSSEQAAKSSVNKTQEKEENIDSETKPTKEKKNFSTTPVKNTEKETESDIMDDF